MNAHPYQPWIVTAAITFIAAMAVVFIAGLASLVHEIQQIRETRVQRRLEQTAAHEEIRQRLQAAADRINRSGLE